MGIATVWGSNTGGAEIFCTCPDRPLGPHSLLYKAYWVSFPGVKRSRRGVEHPTHPHPTPRLRKEYSDTPTGTSGPSWPVLGWFTFTIKF